jgi:cytochrome c-type biogenesis protein CcmH
MNRRRSFTTVALLLMVAGLSIPQTATTYASPDIRRVADRLACKCGSCNNTIATCQMLECHYSSPARTKIATQMKQGLSDQQIIDGFIKEVGLAALAAPPAEGFNLLGYVMPFIAIMLGLAAILVYWQRFRKPAVAAEAKPDAPNPAIDEKYRKQIEAELSEMD